MINTQPVAVDFASNWEVRGGVWRYGIELSRALVQQYESEGHARSVYLPCYDRLPAERLAELDGTGAVVINDAWCSRYDYLESLRRKNGRIVPWKTVLPWVYGDRIRRRLLRRGLRDAHVCHAVLGCRGVPRDGVTVGTIHDLIPLLHADGATLSISPDQFVSMVNDHRRWSALVIVPSMATKRELVEHLRYPEDRIRVVYHGIDTAMFRPDAPSADALMGQHGLVSGEYLLYVGAIEHRKNIDRLVEAYLRSAGSGRTFPLVLSGAIVGELPRLQAILGDGTGRVRYIGYVRDEDLPGLYRGARALVHVSLAEGFGFTPPEAMACGTPVVASKQTATGEIVGEAGLLVDSRSVDEIAQAIRRITTDDALHQQLRINGLARAGQLTWRRCARETTAVYEEALSRRAN